MSSPLCDLRRRLARMWHGLVDEVPADRTIPDPCPAWLQGGRQPAAQYVADAEAGAFVFVLAGASRGSGGLSDVLHLGHALEQGHGLRVSYLVPARQDLAAARAIIARAHAGVRPEQVVDRLERPPEFLCATAWTTANEVAQRPSRRKLYFVQDYEPWFHRRGLRHTYAAASYELGFEMFTLGPWLAGQIRREHAGTSPLGLPFPVSDNAPATAAAPRRRVTFYLQPDKEHRGTELLIEAARRLARAWAGQPHPPLLTVFGSAANDYLAPDFACDWRGVVSEPEIVALLQESRVTVCTSFTNLSLIALRAIYHGSAVCDLEEDRLRGNLPPEAQPLWFGYAPDPGQVVQQVERALAHPPSAADQAGCQAALARRHSWPVCAAALVAWLRKAKSESLGSG